MDKRSLALRPLIAHLPTKQMPISKNNWVYIVYEPFSHVHKSQVIRSRHMSANVDGAYSSPEGASYAAHRLLLSNCPQDHDRVTIQRCHIQDSASALATLKSRERVYYKEEEEDRKEEIQNLIQEANEELASKGAEKKAKKKEEV